MERVARIGAFVLCLLPFVWVLYAAVSGRLGPDPAEALMLFTGEWSLRMLALTLLVSPLRAWTGWSLPMKLRRMLGLYTFFYGCVHFLAFLQFYIGWAPAALTKELAERPYIALGFSAWLLTFLLAITSYPRHAAPFARKLAAPAPFGLSGGRSCVPASVVASTFRCRRCIDLPCYLRCLVVVAGQAPYCETTTICDCQNLIYVLPIELPRARFGRNFLSVNWTKVRNPGIISAERPCRGRCYAYNALPRMRHDLTGDSSPGGVECCLTRR